MSSTVVPGRRRIRQEWPVLALLVALGIVLRLREFVLNFSLNHDDICLALNVMSRGPRGLTHSLDFDQAAPLGFL
jgi:hypothetical protein